MKWVVAIIIYVLIGIGVGAGSEAISGRRGTIEKRAVAVAVWPAIIVARVYFIRFAPRCEVAK